MSGALKLKAPRRKHRVPYQSPLGAKIKIIPSGCTNVGGPCWKWIGAFNNKGYPYVRENGRVEKAYRVVWVRCRGCEEIGGKDLHHRCHHRWCVNPKHLKPIEHTTHMKGEHGWK